MMSSVQHTSATKITTKMHEDDGSKPHLKPECEVLWEGGDGSLTLSNLCQKNPGHKAFIPVDSLTTESLPAGYQTQEHLDEILYYCDTTVKLVVKSTSPKRPDMWPGTDNPYPYNYLKGSDGAWRVGTGYIRDVGIRYGLCPCHLCKKSCIMKIMEVTVVTASHVIYDSIEASSTIVECFFDSNDRAGVKLLYGVEIDRTYVERGKLKRCRSDRCGIKCVTHDKELMRKLDNLMSRRRQFDLGGLSFIVSHPHGLSKKISFGRLCYYTSRKHYKFAAGVPHEMRQLLNNGEKTEKLICRTPLYHQPDNRRLTGDVQNNEPLSSQGEGERNLEEEDECNKFASILTLAEEYEIPATTSFILSQNADYVCRCRRDGKDWWVRLAPGSILTLPDGRMLPSQTEFKLSETRPLVLSDDRYYNYDIPTCPGSSGARVVIGRDDPFLPWYYFYSLPHSGENLRNGTNQSSYA